MVAFIMFMIVINLMGFYIMKVDKRKAKLRHNRISEKTLWTIAIFFGAIGMMFGMQVFHHKTKHIQFKWGLPLLALLEAGFSIYLIKLVS